MYCWHRGSRALLADRLLAPTFEKDGADPEEDALLKKLDAVKWEMLEEWSKTKKAPQHADWLHAKELNKA